ncbi:MAG TPA: hypothetical protein VMN38_04995 [Sphingomicrobium sp.]|nr:hypothetical protein [Sphingomicrobium sp.]
MRILTALVVAGAAAAAFPAIAAQQPKPPIAVADIEESLRAISDIDQERLFKDKSYAQLLLAHLEVVRRSSHYSGETKMHIDRLRMLALTGSGQTKEAYVQATELTRAAPGEPNLHYFAFLLAGDVDSERALDELEFADRSITSVTDRDRFLAFLASDTVNRFRQPFFMAKDRPRIAQSAQVLLNLGWPGVHKLELADNLRMQAAEGLMAKGDVAGAKQLVFSVRTTNAVLQSLISNKWEVLRDSGDPNERLAQSIAASDEATESAVLANSDDLESLLYRAQFLRSVGKSSEALQLILPKAHDLEWVKERGEEGFWIVNEAAYALVDLRREKEAVALMQKLLSIGLSENPRLISMAINSVGIMADAGDYKGAADYAAMLATKHAGIASPYGEMWMWEGAACGNSFAGNLQAAQPWLAKLKAGEKDNPAALTRALLCANDIDGAAAAVIKRLNGDDPEDMLQALQDFTAGPDLPAAKKTLEERLRQAIARPDVQAAIAKHGRVMKVPLSRTYWGMF